MRRKKTTDQFAEEKRLVFSFKKNVGGGGGLKQNICCVKSSMSWLLSMTTIFMTWQTPGLKSLKSDGSCWSGEKPAVVHTPVCTGVGKWGCTRYLLTQHRWPTSCILCMVNGLHRLLHHAIISCYHQHHNVRHLRSTGAHGGKCSVAGRVQEADGFTRWQLDWNRWNIYTHINTVEPLMGDHLSFQATFSEIFPFKLP